MLLTPTLRAQLAHISLSTVRRLAPGPAANPARIVRPYLRLGNARQQQMPAKRLPWDTAVPGYLEIDLVFHCGLSSSGEFGYTLQMIDVATGWSGRRALLGRSYVAVADACDYLLTQQFPFPLYELHPDNGSEFLNANLLRFIAQHFTHLVWSRSRPYRKNDHRNVEQKNATLVRAFLGDYRLDTVKQIRYLNHLYDLTHPYYNFFQPVLHLVEKTYTPAQDAQPARLHRQHDQARPPLQRLLETEVLTATQQAALVAQRAQLNPRQLRRDIYAGLDHLFAYPGATPGQVESVFETLAYPELFPEALKALEG